VEVIVAKTNPIQVQKYLSGIDYPARKEDLIKRAEEQGADEELLSTLNSIEDEEFETPADVSKAIGQVK
jgi:hypothetical protein